MISPTPTPTRTLTFTRWALPLVVASSLFMLSLPERAAADSFDTSTRSLGGYALLRQGDLAGAQEFFANAALHDPRDPLALQGLGELALFRQDFEQAAGYVAQLAAQQEWDRVAWLEARSAHAGGRWSVALEGYAQLTQRPGWTTWAQEGIAAIYRELGDLPFTGVMQGLAAKDAQLGVILNQERATLRLADGFNEHHDTMELAGQNPYDAPAFVAVRSFDEIEAAVRGFWAAREDSSARHLLAAAVAQSPRDARVQTLLREQLLHEMNQTPVPPAKVKLPASALAEGWLGESGWNAQGYLAQDLTMTGPLLDYWNGIEAISAVSDQYYVALVGQFAELRTSIALHSATRDGQGLQADLGSLHATIVHAAEASRRETAALAALPTPFGFETFAQKMRSFQDLRTQAFVDLEQAILTQDERWLTAVEAKIVQFDPLAEEAAAEFLAAYGRAPMEWKTLPVEEPAAEEGAEGEAESEEDESQSTGRRLYGPEFDFEVPEDGSLEPIGEG